MRAFELARELNITSKALLERLRAQGVNLKTHMSAVPDDVAQQLRGAPTSAPEPPSVPGEDARIEVARPKPVSPPVDEPRAPSVADETPPPPVRTSVPESPTPLPAKDALAVEPAPDAELPQPESPRSSDATEGTSDRVISVRGSIVVRDFAESLGIKPNQLIAELMMMNTLVSINEKLDIKTAQKVADKYGFTIEQERKAVEFKPVHIISEEESDEDLPEDLRPRPPVVTFMGHIDHGKTSLLDYIRKSSIAKKEAGGITQHIGAYTILHGDKPITFLDTPGHAAFTAMRARGADLTDIAVIVVAANDGIMPQTQEAIKHAQAATDTTIMIAINKIDLPSADPDRIKQQLQALGMTTEDWGGDLICCLVSAQTGEGIDQFLEMLLLQAEVLELKANPSARAKGFVVEAQMESGMGPTATLMVTRGTLKVGDVVVCGACFGRIKALINAHGEKLQEAGPSTPVRCMGLSAVPPAGESFRVYPNERAARQMADHRAQNLRDQHLAAPSRKASLDNLFERIEESQRLELKLVLKCDTQGSLEAVQQVLSEILSDKIHINILLASIGGITENDVLLASASSAVIIGFNVGKNESVTRAAKHEGVEIRLYSIIYNIVDEVREAMAGMLAPELREKIIGKAEVRQVFPISKTGKIAGCLAISGRLRSRCRVRVRRNDELMFEGTISTLKRFQDEVTEVREGQECGIRLDKFADFEPGDILEFFEVEKIAAKL